MWTFLELVKVKWISPKKVQIRHGTKEWTFSFHKLNPAQQIKNLQNGVSSINRLNPNLRQFLLENQLIYKNQTFSPDQDERTKHWLSYASPQVNQDWAHLQSKQVAIFGVGGMGCLIAEHLVRAGLKKLILVDAAQVDAPDLNRQLSYRSCHLGQDKTAALKSNLKQIRSDVDIECHQRLIQSAGDAVEVLKDKSLDLILCCMDWPKFAIQAALALAGKQLGVGVAYGAVGAWDAILGPICLNPQDLDQLAARFSQASLAEPQPPDLKESKVIRGSLSFTNTIAAATLGLEIYKFLLSGPDECDLINQSKRLDFFRIGALSKLQSR